MGQTLIKVYKFGTFVRLLVHETSMFNFTSWHNIGKFIWLTVKFLMVLACNPFISAVFEEPVKILLCFPFFFSVLDDMKCNHFRFCLVFMETFQKSVLFKLNNLFGMWNSFCTCSICCESRLWILYLVMCYLASLVFVRLHLSWIRWYFHLN